MPSVAVRVAVERWLGTDGAGGDIFGEPFYALPNGEKGVVYCSRKQTLSAKLQGIIDNLLCFPENADGVPTFDPDAVGCEIVDEEIELILETLNANAFNFIVTDLDSGDYKVTVESEITTNTNSQKGTASAKGMVGMGSMVIDEVASSRTRTRAAAGDAPLKRMPASRSAALSQPRSSKAAANAEPSCYAVGM